jgi:hypothetical protein
MTSSTIPVAAATCPSWCAAHLGSGQETTHIGRDRVVAVHSPFEPAERSEIYVSLEQVAESAEAAVRLSGAQDIPMTALQALQVGSALVAAALAGLAGGAR